MARTLFKRIWDPHVVREEPGSPRSSTSISTWFTRSPRRRPSRAAARRPPRPPSRPLAGDDEPQDGGPVTDPLAHAQVVDALRANCAEFGVPLLLASW